MINQKNTNSHEKLTFTEIPFSNPTALALPGVTSETQKVVIELLEKNHENFDIFFHENLYHNHFVHHILTAYSMGASVEHLKEIYYENHSVYQRPKPPSKFTITRENWTEHLGKSNLWTDYLEFFDAVVKEDGMEKALNAYAFHPKLFPHLFAGVYHSAIHLGYGVEFQIPLVFSEGLAQAAVHPNEYEKVLDESFFSSERVQKKSIMDIIKSTQTEDRFDIIVHSIQLKRQKLLAERGNLVKDLAKDWEVPETEEGIREAARELYEACIILYGSTAIRPDHEATHLDFYLMHGLTSVLMIYGMLPYLSLDKQRMLLKAHFTGVLTEYIAQGRPALNIEAMNNYVPKTMTESPNPWLEVIRRSLQEEDCHVIKANRALLRAEQIWPPAGKNNIYLKLAQLTCESYRARGWARNVGFKEQWTEAHEQRVKLGKIKST